MGENANYFHMHIISPNEFHDIMVLRASDPCPRLCLEHNFWYLFGNFVCELWKRLSMHDSFILVK